VLEIRFKTAVDYNCKNRDEFTVALIRGDTRKPGPDPPRLSFTSTVQRWAVGSGLGQDVCTKAIRESCCQPLFLANGPTPERTTKMPSQGRKPSYRLTFSDAVKVWLLHWQGEFQNRIAATFDVNPGRVNEVLKGFRHPGSEQAARSSLH